MNKKQNIIYLAGLLDGEGHFRVQNAKNGEGRSYLRPEIDVTNTNEEICIWLELNFGGKYRSHKGYRWHRMTRLFIDNHHGITVYVRSILKAQGRNFDICELCGKSTDGRPELHHEKYEKATLKDIKIVCHLCNMKAENKGLA